MSAQRLSASTVYYHGPPQNDLPYNNTYTRPTSYDQTSSRKSKTSSYITATSTTSQNDIFSGHMELDRQQRYEKERTRLKDQDSNMKFRIRALRILSRVFAACLSIAIVVEQAIVVMKFLKTRNRTYPAGNGRQVQAWPEQPITIYSYVYFGVSTISMILDLIAVVAYAEGVHRSNKVDTISTVWSSCVFVGNILIWAGAVSVYRYGKHKVDGRWRDLWGWSCSDAASELQPFVTDVNFKQLCGVQASSFYIGIAEIVAAVLSTIIFILMIRRTRTKKQLKNHTESKLLDEASSFS